MKSWIVVLLLCLEALCVQGQEATGTSRFEVEVDPIAYALNGYSFHGIYVNNRIRADLGVFGIRQPDGFGGNDGYRVRTQGFGLKVNYLLNQQETWFAGIGAGLSNNEICNLKTDEKQTEKVLGVGVHLGYRWFLFKKSEGFLRNLYLAPWFSLDYNHVDNATSFPDYEQQPVSIFPTVHIGYRFRAMGGKQ
jgi:outer membrane protein assembly factor BamA